MKRVVEYTYLSNTCTCQCCSNEDSYYDVLIDGEYVERSVEITFICNEEELRKELAHLEPFEVSEHSVYF